jgi:hypothetical protein
MRGIRREPDHYFKAVDGANLCSLLRAFDISRVRQTRGKGSLPQTRGIERQLDHYSGRKMERTHVRCHGITYWSELTFAATDMWHPA